ncbi:hypothetical protein JNW88_23565 [Micromonospora sp. ATA32]|nr:hypothetical protein [Micromonospora sp. ATA32]
MLIERLLSAGAIQQDVVVTMDDRPAFRTLQAVRHPDDPVQEGTGIGLGRRLLFQQVPEGKAGEPRTGPRIHLDVMPTDRSRDNLFCVERSAAERVERYQVTRCIVPPHRRHPRTSRTAAARDLRSWGRA